MRFAVQCLKTEVLSTLRSTASSLTSRAEADAAWLENRASQRALGGTAGSMDSVSAAVREFRQLQRDFSLDDFTESVRGELRNLDADCRKDFRGLSAEQRRKVHLVAAELGMLSQSFGLSRDTRSRSVRVTNILSNRGALVDENPSHEGVLSDINSLVGTLTEEASQIEKSLQQRGQEEKAVAALLILLSTASPWLLGSGSAELYLPLATGTVGLCTAWQETAGKGAVATAKRQSAFLLTREARAELFLGRAQIAYAALPTDLAVATLATTATVLAVELRAGSILSFTALSMVIPAMAACSVAMHRRRKVERFVAASMRCVDARPACSSNTPWKQTLQRNRKALKF